MEYQATGPVGIVLDKYSRTPIYEQVVEQFKKRILTGELAADDLLPSVRSLSVELGVNPNTLQKAYTELDRLALSYTVAGNGRFVHPNAKAALQKTETKVLYDSLREILQKLSTAGQSKQAILQAVQSFLDFDTDETAETVGKETTTDADDKA